MITMIFFNFQMLGSPVLYLGIFILVVLSMLGIGMMIGGIASNIKVANMTASLLYFPIIVFLGATLPYEIMHTSL